jgi:hypothetical protein
LARTGNSKQYLHVRAVYFKHFFDKAATQEKRFKQKKLGTHTRSQKIHQKQKTVGLVRN